MLLLLLNLLLFLVIRSLRSKIIFSLRIYARKQVVVIDVIVL